MWKKAIDPSMSLKGSPLQTFTRCTEWLERM
nr:MAG TPA_asm: hypothetical protein [Caudoviricetes sp.]